MFNTLEIAKLAANLTVQYVASKVATDVITSNTRFNEDDISVRVASGVVAWQVGTATKEHTDSAVDKAAAWIAEKKNQKATK